MGKDTVKVVGIAGSLRLASTTRKAVEITLEGAKETGADIEYLDLQKYDLVFCDGKEDESKYPKDVFKLREKVKSAQGIILGTPEYHGSYSGVLKNALDLMGFDEFEGKVLGLVGVAGGALGANHALNSLRVVGRALHAWVVPSQASIPNTWKAFDEEGNLTDSKLAERLKGVGQEVARFAYLKHSKQAQDFLANWEGSQPNPGGE